MTVPVGLVYNPIAYFNSHPHIEDDLELAWQVRTDGYFNSHPHIEDDRKYVQIQAVQSLEFATYS